MRKVLSCKLYLLGLALVVCLSVYSVVTYKKIRTFTSHAQNSMEGQGKSAGVELLWDILSRQFVTAASVSR
jgi:hypothetical protein